jgi:hypothetical protein
MGMASNPSEGPLESAAKGAVKGFLEWTAERVKEYAQKIKRKDAYLLQNVGSFEELIKQRKTTEFQIFRENIDDEDLRNCFQMGLTLRGIEDNPESCKALRNTILKTYKAKGLHVAQFVQNGIFAKFIGRYLEESLTPKEMKKEIQNLFDNIELTNSFVQVNDDIRIEVEKIVNRINSHNPRTYVISGLGSVKEKCRQIAREVLKRVNDYSLETYSTERKIIIFLNRIDSF